MHYKNINTKGAILDKERLCDYLEKTASQHVTKSFSDKQTYPIWSLIDNYNKILETYNLLNEHAKLKISIEPAGEWILDNFYVIEETVKYIQKELNVKKYRNYIGLADGRYKGFARIYAIANEIATYTDGKINEENIKSFLSAYQKKKILTIDEIWDFPIFMQIAIIQNIRDICDIVHLSQIQKYKVESIIERLVEKKSYEKLKFNNNIEFIKRKNKDINKVFIEYLSFKLKSYGKKGIAYLNVLEEEVNKVGYTIGDVIKQAHFQYAINKVSMGNLITSIKEISRIDFSEISKQIGGIEEILLQDPSGIYEKMDFNTKNDYQNRIREISRQNSISEIYIAKEIIRICNKENEKNLNNEPSDYEINMHKKRTHIGYYLYDGIDTLYKSLKINRKQTNNNTKIRGYMAISLILPLYLCLITFYEFYSSSKNVLISLLSSVILYLPYTEIILQVLIYVLNKITKPKRLPKLDFSHGIPEEAATFVVIPTIIPNAKKAKEIIQKLEVYHLANKSENIYFALLGDVTAGNRENEPYDNEIIKTGIEQIKLLNEKYQSNGLNRFHFLYRKRKWNPKEACFIGWERKRGLLLQFNDFLLDTNNNDFRFNSIIEQLDLLPKIKYVITLDSDTNLVINSALELVGTMEHILNKPIVKDGRVVHGHGIIEPRIGIDLDSYAATTFSKIYAGIGGIDLYSNAISDVYQDNFDEGIFTGKGIYDLKLFSSIAENQIPENTVLSHDLLEGSYLRCGLASDILLLDGFPSKYCSYMTRLSRWIRGDWQIIKWITNRIKIRNETHTKNPLNQLSKFKILDNLRRSLIPVFTIILLIIGIARNNIIGYKSTIIRANHFIYPYYYIFN